jgi:hypothetical protein
MTFRGVPEQWLRRTTLQVLGRATGFGLAIFGLDASCLRNRATYAAAGYQGAAAESRCESPGGLHFLRRYDCARTGQSEVCV